MTTEQFIQTALLKNYTIRYNGNSVYRAIRGNTMLYYHIAIPRVRPAPIIYVYQEQQGQIIFLGKFNAENFDFPVTAKEKLENQNQKS